jgi:hypothetical protein
MTRRDLQPDIVVKINLRIWQLKVLAAKTSILAAADAIEASRQSCAARLEPPRRELE